VHSPSNSADSSSSDISLIPDRTFKPRHGTLTAAEPKSSNRLLAKTDQAG